MFSDNYFGSSDSGTTGSVSQAVVDQVVNTALVNYATLDQLALKADTSQLGTYATKTELAGKSDSGHTHSNYATTTQLGLKADTSQLANYATTTQLGLKADTSQLANYATTTQLALKADISQLGTYATKTELAGKSDSGHTHSNYATVTQLGLKADITTLVADYATKSELGGKVSTSVLNDYATKTELAGKVNTSVLNDYATKTELAGKSDSGHTHSTYALQEHTHPEYVTVTSGLKRPVTWFEGLLDVNEPYPNWGFLMIWQGTTNGSINIKAPASWDDIPQLVNNEMEIFNSSAFTLTINFMYPTSSKLAYGGIGVQRWFSQEPISRFGYLTIAPKGIATIKVIKLTDTSSGDAPAVQLDRVLTYLVVGTLQ